MKNIKLKAKIRISTSKGSFSPGEMFEIEEKYAKRLIGAGYAEIAAEKDVTVVVNSGEDNANKTVNPEKELHKLNKDELKELSEIIGFDAGDLKKDDLIEKIIEEIKSNEAFEELLEMKADEIKAYLNNE